MKIYILLITIIAAVLAFWIREIRLNVELEAENAQIINANAELNATLSEVILQNERDMAILKEKHKFDLENVLKTQKALNYVKKSDDSNASQLFNDTILLLQ